MSHRHRPGRDKFGYLSEDTIAAAASALGGAVAILRISGPHALEALERLAGRSLVGRAPRTLHRVRLKSPVNGQEIDDALFAYFQAPSSFTGEDVVELHLHGSAFIVSHLLETLAETGIRQALPGEFSFRAVRNGKMSLNQASAVADLIAASNSGAVTLALEKLSGTQNRLISTLAQDLRALAMLGEAGIDFSDQDLDEVALPSLKRRLEPLVAALERLQTSYQRGIRLQDGVSVTFVGLPNAGKSSFFNALLGEDRSIVSDLPGTTRDVVRERLTLEGRHGSYTLRLEDTAGLRATENTIEQQGIHRSHKSAREADLILLLIDPTADLNEALHQWELLGAPDTKALGIITKTDLCTPERVSELKKYCGQAFAIAPWIATSAVDATGIDEAVDEITHFCSRLITRQKGEVLLTRTDQLQSVRAAVEDLSRASTATELELFASDIRQALHSLAPLIGETPADDVLSMIFSQFCIGK